MKKTKRLIQYLNRIALLLGIVLISSTTSVWGQSAPALRAVVSADAAPEAMSQFFAKLGDGERTISVPGAAWLQLQFSEVRLGPDGVLTITDSSGQTQTFSQAQITAWGGLSAAFNGSELRINLRPGQGAVEPVSARIKDIIIGLPASAVGGAEIVTPQALRNLLGPDIKRFLPDDLRELRQEGVAPRQGAGTEAICGSTDDRVASNNPRVGRIMPIGCTGWLFDGGHILTAGHCIGTATQMVEFNVPASKADGTTVAPLVRDQYRVISGSIVSKNTGVGNDWAVFRVLPNTQTGLMPAAAQGATFQLSNTNNPTQVRITGYGVDGPAPNFGAGGPRNKQNQTQQTHVGTLSQNTGGATSGVLRYNTDTQGGNSGSPVIVAGGNIAIGIHTNGGCSPTGGTNAGTSLRNAALWSTLQMYGRANGPLAPSADGRLELMVVGNDGQLWAKWQTAPSNGWTGWAAHGKPAGVNLTNSPRLAASADGRLELMVVGNDGQLWAKWQTAPSNGWSGWAAHGKPAGVNLVGSPMLARSADGRMELMVVGNDGQLWAKWQTAPSNGWSGWAAHGKPAGVNLVGSPMLAPSADGRLELMVVGNDGRLWAKYQTAPSNGWSGWAAHGKPAGVNLVGSPMLARSADGRLELMVVGNDGRLWAKYQTAPSNGWSGWAAHGKPAGVNLVGSPMLAPSADGRLELMVVGNDGQLWAKWQTAPSNGWSGWAAHGKPAGVNLIGSPMLAPSADGRLELMVVGNDGRLWAKWQTAPSNGWSGWAAHGKPAGVNVLPVQRP